MSPEYLNSIVTLTVGFVALVVYKLAKIDEKRNAAIIIVMDIRHAEQVIRSILDKGAVDTFTKNIISENNWEKYKHLFATQFTQDDFEAFNRFFEACVEIAEARNRMHNIFTANLQAKAEILQQKILSIDYNNPAWEKERAEIIEFGDKESYTFSPNEPKTRINKSMELMGTLTNTIAFEKLKKTGRMKS